MGPKLKASYASTVDKLADSIIGDILQCIKRLMSS